MLQCDSRIVLYDCSRLGKNCLQNGRLRSILLRQSTKKVLFIPITSFVRGGSPGLVVKGDDSCSGGCGFKSQRHILDGHFSHGFVVKIVLFV